MEYFLNIPSILRCCVGSYQKRVKFDFVLLCTVSESKRERERWQILFLLLNQETERSPCSFDYFNEPCTTVAVKKTGTPSFCTPTKLMISAVFVSCFEKDLIEHNCFRRE